MPKLQDTIQETVIKSIAEMLHAYFPKIIPNVTCDSVDISDIVVPPF
jgi:hypothetical protein